MKVNDGRKTYDVVIVGSPNPNTGYTLVGNALYPNIVDDFEKIFRVMKSRNDRGAVPSHLHIEGTSWRSHV